MIKWVKQIRATGGFYKAFVRYFTKGRSNRSVGGTVFLLIFIALFAVFALFPVLFMVGNAFKPIIRPRFCPRIPRDVISRTCWSMPVIPWCLLPGICSTRARW